MKQVTINGKQYNMQYSFYAACMYERITGKNALELTTTFEKVENIFYLGYAMLISTDGNGDVPSTDVIMKTMTAGEINSFINAISEEVQSFYAAAPGDTKQDAIADNEGEDGEKKA